MLSVVGRKCSITYAQMDSLNSRSNALQLTKWNCIRSGPRRRRVDHSQRERAANRIVSDRSEDFRGYSWEEFPVPLETEKRQCRDWWKLALRSGPDGSRNQQIG